MMTLFIWFHLLIIVGVHVRSEVSGLLQKPYIESPEKQMNIEDTIMIRCKFGSGIRCYFYNNQSEVPFRTMPFKEDFQFCHVSVSIEELVGEKEFGASTEVFLSCVVEVMVDGQLMSSMSSDFWQLKVVDKLSQLGRPRIEPHSKPVKGEDVVQMFCYADTGTRCHFYNNFDTVPLVSVPYSKEFNACSLALPVKELVSERHSGKSPQILLRCSVEVKLGETMVISRRSQSIRVNLEDDEQSVLIGLCVSVLLIIIVAAGLTLVCCKYTHMLTLFSKTDQRNNIRNHYQESSYLDIDADGRKKTLEISDSCSVNGHQQTENGNTASINTAEKTEGEVCYASVNWRTKEQRKQLKKPASVMQVNQSEEYATVKFIKTTRNLRPELLW
ncbi:uncharacterized protein [Lepisosteus oculatus]|uniref:uncharacterized protein n=1 Tax=Lepisosteus oculatus TaxID=7918 RepID=UPI0035F5229F